MSRGHFNVAPRYTPGSPALVDEGIALRVALQERSSVVHILDGLEGEKNQARAKRLGLGGIVEYRVSRGSGKKEGWEVTDVITGEKFFRLSSGALRKLGWTAWADLDTWQKKLVTDQCAEEPIVDVTRGHYKFTLRNTGCDVTYYKPEILNTGVWPWLALRPTEEGVDA
jgi:hypothetical protein